MVTPMADAPFVFEGTVKAAGTSNVKSLPADRSTALVTVDHVRQAPRSLAGLAGKEITLRVAEGETLKVGMKAIFSADGLLFAENLALQSRGHEPLESVARSAALIGTVPVVQRLRKHVDDAALVVSGRVSQVRANERSAKVLTRGLSPDAPTRVSEHEPFWRQAVIQVSQVHKGPKKKEVTVSFPSSTDVMWRKAPKFTKGQTGVFILHTPAPAPAIAARSVRGITPPPLDAYVALDPNDYLPPSAVPALQAMLPNDLLGASQQQPGVLKVRAARAPIGRSHMRKAAKKATKSYKKRS